MWWILGSEADSGGGLFGLTPSPSEKNGFQVPTKAKPGAPWKENNFKPSFQNKPPLGIKHWYPSCQSYTTGITKMKILSFTVIQRFQAKIYENLANNFIKTKAKNESVLFKNLLFLNF